VAEARHCGKTRTAAKEDRSSAASPVEGWRTGALAGNSNEGGGMAGGHRVAVLIACKNGAETIANSVRSAIEQADVYVVSDGSDDATGDVAREAGATVLDRDRSGGKPDALRSGNRAFDLARSYDYIAILDDDTILEPGYLDKLTAKMDADATIAAASGRIDSVWDHARRWNALIAMRAFMYWSYQTTIKRGQNALRVVNVICGANTAFRAEVFEQLINEDAPYAIDDMYWLAEIIRRKLGRVDFVHDARSWTMDPHRLGDWYKQTVRWSWGQFQSVRGHRLGAPFQRRLGSASRLGVLVVRRCLPRAPRRLVLLRRRAARDRSACVVARTLVRPGLARRVLPRLEPCLDLGRGVRVAEAAPHRSRARDSRSRSCVSADDVARSHQDDLSTAHRHVQVGFTGAVPRRATSATR
jgi:hypothetical protein